MITMYEISIEDGYGTVKLCSSERDTLVVKDESGDERRQTLYLNQG